eukprot:6897537-Prymnesium_polylepis.1
MAYDAPGGGVGRYARPAVPLADWHEVRVDERTSRVAFGLWCAVRRYPALRALCGAVSVWHEIRVDERTDR